MNQSSQQLEDIKIIKKIMEESSRFLSLSGLSGVFMGLFAIAGAVAAHLMMPENFISGQGYTGSFMADPEGKRIVGLLLADAGVVLFLALVAALWFSYRKATKSGHSIWTPVSRRLLVNLFIPLATGGLFILITLGKIPGTVSVAATLIFYGLALVNAAKFTFGEIYWMGVLEVVTGLICILFPGYTILIWAFGFGVLHITYGFYMHFKYLG